MSPERWSGTDDVVRLVELVVRGADVLDVERLAEALQDADAVVSAIGVGAVALGAVMLASGAIATLVPANRLAADWGLATMAYALTQALTAAAFSGLFHATGSFNLLFGIGAASLAVCAGLIAVAAVSK